ncbi:pectinesterase A [Aliirhizobium smilacinae]|uniref:Pectinesterase A n=2 Tax=Aliirhizobium smilacinae TaxID=1395944 RepID=A0A5C4XQT4_9HYPH|nr:pectinesterase A [Rhizobium smilacinae]
MRRPVLNLFENNRRTFIKGLCLMPFSTVCFNAASAAQDRKPSAWVDTNHSGKAGELVEGAPVYRTIDEALAAAPGAATQTWVIAIKPGRYREKLTVTKPNISFVGAGRDSTVITFDAFAGQDRPDGQGQWGTPGSATVTIQAPDFSSRGITIANTFDFLENDRRDKTSSDRVGASQAVALMLDTGADRSLFQEVALTGYQDTLFANVGRSLFEGCHISGNVDFIFGAGAAFFERCNIVSRYRGSADTLPAGFVTAPSTMIDQESGLIFHNCRLTKEGSDIPAGSHYLGRPWHPTKTFAEGRYADPNAIGVSVFLNCHMDDHIAEDGWTAMQGTALTGPRKWFQPLEDARFSEYGSTGPGACINAKRPQLDEEKAEIYSMANVLQDWQPTPMR